MELDLKEHHLVAETEVRLAIVVETFAVDAAVEGGMVVIQEQWTNVEIDTLEIKIRGAMIMEAVVAILGVPLVALVTAVNAVAIKIMMMENVVVVGKWYKS